MKVYIATSLENHAQHTRLRDALAHIDISVSYDWTVHGSVQKDGTARIREVALRETYGVLDADFVVVIMPGGRGTHVELGMALALGKRVVLFAPDDLMDDSGRTCAFYHHPLVSHVRHEDGFENLLARIGILLGSGQL